MIKQFNFFLSVLLKQRQRYHQASINNGFTLIELLVAMVLAFLVITPLLGFMIDILNTDRKEQAKINSEQEVQSALDYIAQDLQQSIYIYDAKGIKAIKDQLPQNTATDRVPVLVFWKREFDKNVIDVTVGGASQGKNDTFVYSLVAYYLVKDTIINDADNIWSDQFRIARFEVKDGVKNPDVAANASNNYFTGKTPDPGFLLFDLAGSKGTLEQKMNNWKKKSGEDYTNPMLTLVDYIDKNPLSADTSFAKTDCTSSTVFPDRALIGNESTEERIIKEAKIAALQIPTFAATNSNQYSTTTDAELQNSSSFYACVDSERNIAKVFIRGNALARIDKNNNIYSSTKSSFFPKASIQVEGKGRIGFQ